MPDDDGPNDGITGVAHILTATASTGIAQKQGCSGQLTVTDGTRDYSDIHLHHFSIRMTYCAFDGAKRDFPAHTATLVSLTHTPNYKAETIP